MEKDLKTLTEEADRIATEMAAVAGDEVTKLAADNMAKSDAKAAKEAARAARQAARAPKPVTRIAQPNPTATLAPPPPQGPPPPSLEFVGVSKSFTRGKKTSVAIVDINATVNDLASCSEFVCIIGPSGCGKSTLLSLIAGHDTHYPPTTGIVRFHGEEVVAPGPDRGMLFQDYNCYPHLTVFDNIAFGLKLHAKEMGLSRGDVRDLTKEWLANVKLSDSDAVKYPAELSGGMRQRVAIARTLALRPKCLLMDEPFSALDEPTRYEMQDLVTGLRCKTEMTVVMVSHSVSEAVYLADRVWLMSKGPGTIMEQFTEVPYPTEDMSAMVEQSRKDFAECAAHVKYQFYKMLQTPREQIKPIVADHDGCGRARLSEEC